MRKNTLNRRHFLAGTGAAAAGAGLTLWLPKWARGAGAGSIRHVILVFLNGGVRWMTSFGATDNIKYNPWGLLPFDLAPLDQRAHTMTPGTPWSVSRMFHLKPMSPRDHTFAQAYAKLSSTDPSHYNFHQSTLSRWPGSPALPTLGQIANQISVVSCDAYPGGPALVDHAAGMQNLFTGNTTGTVGMATLFNKVLKGRTRLPAIAVNSPGFALGAGSYAQSRPLVLQSALSLPTTDPGKGLSDWARKFEAQLDSSVAQDRPGFVKQAIENFALDKQLGDENIRTLVENSLKIATAPLETAFGTLTTGEPLTNGMLREVFGVNSTDLETGDILHDAYRAVNQPAWVNNPFGLSGALAVRFLQYGSPVVAFTLGSFDTHSNELLDQTRTLPNQMIQFGRMLTGLEFALKRVADPDTGGTLWDSTLVVAGSEFGRQGNGIQPNGFNTGMGSDHSREQFFPVMGGPLKQTGQLLSDSGGRAYHMNSLWTALIEGMGGVSDYLRPEKFPPIADLFKR